jgi:lysophospholipase L1-like esterase
VSTRRLIYSSTFRIALAGMLLAAVGFALATPAPGHAAVRPMTVFAVGDSYASGEGAIGPGWVDSACHLSALAGPQDASQRLRRFRPTSFTSFACSGARTASLLGSSGQLSKLPPGQIDALTVSIGGNDIGFADILANCGLAPVDCSVLDSPVSASLTRLPPSLDAVFSAVPANVADVFVTEYPDPTTGVFGARCGSPASPAFQGLDGITEGEATWASDRVVGRLNATLSAAVGAANARPGAHPVFHFVTGISARFASHGYCTGGGSPAPWAWANPRFISTLVDSVTSQGDPRGIMHPNDLGQQAIGEALAADMQFLTVVGPTRVPPVVGDEADVARHTLEAAGFDVRIQSKPDRSCNNIGRVLSQSPRGGSVVNGGSTVTITIGDRPPTPCP